MTIKPGDLVCVIGSTCDCNSLDIGTIATVTGLLTIESYCGTCRKDHPNGLHAHLDWGDGTDAYKPVTWLQRIDPLREPEIIEERLAVKA